MKTMLGIYEFRDLGSIVLFDKLFHVNTTTNCDEDRDRAYYMK